MRYPTLTERAEAESQRANLAIAAQTAAEQENIVLRQRLRDLGIESRRINHFGDRMKVIKPLTLPPFGEVSHSLLGG